MQTFALTRVYASASKRNPLRVAKFAFEYQYRSYFQTDRKALGRWLKEEMVALGPAYIKMGQFLSTRIDIFGKDVIAELGELQDRIEPVPFEDIEVILKKELVAGVNTVFSEFEREPIATASIGQVHKARLRKSGRAVVVKVQKPGAAESIRDDIQLLKQVIGVLAPLNLRQVTEAESLILQYEGYLSVELDYQQERANMVLFRDLFKGIPWVQVPRVYPEFTSREVLVMEYVPSTKINDLVALKRRKIDTSRVARNLMQTFLQMIVYYGNVHCDPHPGNLGIGADGDTIVLYDFGNVVALEPTFYKKMRDLLFAVYQKDVDEFLTMVLDMNILVLEEGSDRAELREFFALFFNYLDSPDLLKLKDSILANEILNESEGLRFRVDQNFLSLFRVFSLLDGTCNALDPKFSYLDALAPFAEEVMGDTSFITTKISKDFAVLQSYPKIIKKTDQSVERVNRKVKQMEGTGKKIGVGLMVWALVDNIDSPGKLLVLVPIIGWALFKN